MEAVACTWPTPFGSLLPGSLGKLMADSWCLGDVAILFCMTRPTYVESTVPFDGDVPNIVWLLMGAYAGLGLLLIVPEVRWLRKHLKPEKPRSAENAEPQ